MSRPLVFVFIIASCFNCKAQALEDDIDLIRQCLNAHIIIESPLVNSDTGMPDDIVKIIYVGKSKVSPYVKVLFDMERENIVDGKTLVTLDGKSFECWIDAEKNTVLSLYYETGGGKSFQKVISKVDIDEKSGFNVSTYLVDEISNLLH